MTSFVMAMNFEVHNLPEKCSIITCTVRNKKEFDQLTSQVNNQEDVKFKLLINDSKKGSELNIFSENENILKFISKNRKPVIKAANGKVDILIRNKDNVILGFPAYFASNWEKK